MVPLWMTQYLVSNKGHCNLNLPEALLSYKCYNLTNGRESQCFLHQISLFVYLDKSVLGCDSVPFTKLFVGIVVHIEDLDVIGNGAQLGYNIAIRYSTRRASWCIKK